MNAISNLQLSAIELVELLAAHLIRRMPVLVTGAPGVGKTDVAHQAASRTGFADVVVTHPAVEDPTDIKGLPTVDVHGNARWAPYGLLARVLSATSPTVLLADDLGQGSASVQAGYMQLLLARRVGEHALPDCVSIIACTNRRTDRAGVSGILEPVKGRCTVVEMVADVDAWSQWAVSAGVDPYVIAFNRLRPELLSAFVPSADMTNSPTPRNWAAVSTILSMGLSTRVEMAAIAGRVGEGAAMEFAAFRTTAKTVNVDAVLLDPRGAVLPTRPDTLYALTTALATRAAKRWSAIAIIAERLLQEGRAEFGALLVRDSIRRAPDVTATAEFVNLAAGELGAAIG
jgi:hypothetical protein